DCFFAGCVPIYWGANNVTDYIAENCFIDKRKFKTYDELYNYMTSMSDQQYLEYLDNIEKYLNSDKIKPFTVEYFAEIISREIINDMI
ncbi:hypothetical protein GJU94_16550, partial [Brucella sp. 10RB9214]